MRGHEPSEHALCSAQDGCPGCAPYSGSACGAAYRQGHPDLGTGGEYGVVAPVGIQQLRRALPRWMEDAENGLSDGFRVLLNGLADDLRYLDDCIAALNQRITDTVNQDPVARRLMTLRGALCVSVVVCATAMWLGFTGVYRVT